VGGFILAMWLPAGGSRRSWGLELTDGETLVRRIAGEHLIDRGCVVEESLGV